LIIVAALINNINLFIFVSKARSIVTYITFIAFIFTAAQTKNILVLVRIIICINYWYLLLKSFTKLRN